MQWKCAIWLRILVYSYHSDSFRYLTILPAYCEFVTFHSVLFRTYVALRTTFRYFSWLSSSSIITLRFEHHYDSNKSTSPNDFNREPNENVPCSRYYMSKFLSALVIRLSSTSTFSTSSPTCFPIQRTELKNHTATWKALPWRRVDGNIQPIKNINDVSEKRVETREIRKKKKKNGREVKKKCYLGSSDDRKVMTSILRLPRIKRRAVPVLHLVPPVSACLFWLACPRLPFCQLYLLFHSYGRRLDHEPCPFTRTAAHARSLAPDGYPIG